ncbi:hypothetical protein MVEN_00990000 [Mycena venus]|uniref:Non-specific serine/threonine protein kinase n=1 Tax=Mycena venus TaxID=2733690 RepID=A0A8H7D2Q0_9AGAR|nr:hypothetical protein MVEN_00990000 [Mycena venus]
MAFRSPVVDKVEEGPVAVKKPGLLSSWRGWTEKWMVLSARYLTIYKNRVRQQATPESGVRIPLNSITRLERTHSSRKGHCLLLDAAGTRYLLAFRSDNDLYNWHDKIYSISPLTLFNAGDNTEFDVENIIRGYGSSADSPDLSSRPSTPRTLPRKLPGTADPLPMPLLFRSRTDSPASSRQLLLDLDDLQGQKAPIVEPVPTSGKSSNGLRPSEREVIRKAVSLLCNLMEPRLLRKSEPGGEKPFDLVEIRLRSLSRMKRRWGKHELGDVPDAEEMQTFAEALRDGYVLCQLLNTLHSSPVVRPDARGQDYNSSLNITKFLAACTTHGLASTDLFLPPDLVEASGYSLARVANTIIALVQASETPSPHTAPKPVAALVDDQLPAVQRATKDLDDWVENFIALTRQKMISDQLDGAPDGLESGVEPDEFSNSKVYQHLISFITNLEASRDEKFCAVLERLVRFMASLDPVWSLVQSAQFRIKLLKISSVLGVANDRRLRDALQKDDADVARLFKLVVSTDTHKKAVLRLKGGSAQQCVDLIQDVLDKGSFQAPEDAGFTLKARRLLVKLSEASDTLPKSLFITGVSSLDKEATFGGTFGDIYRASYQGQDVALKRIRVFQRDSGRHKIRQRFCREALLWQRLQNPYVLPFTGIDAESFPSFLCMVSPWMRHGTILKHLAENGNANVERRLFEIAQGLAYLHSQDIIHGDLRGSNILVDDEWHACLADFGLAVFSDATAATHTSHHGGSVRWMSPELHYPQSCGLDTFKRTFASDVYSFAFVCVELYTGKPPFSDISHDAAVMLRVMAKERPARPSDADGRELMSEELWALVQQCWSHDVEERPTMARVVELMQDANEELRIVPPIMPFLPRIPRTPPGTSKQTFQVHRSSRRRPKGQGPNAAIYQSLSF